MRVEGSRVGFSSSHQLSVEQTESVSLRVWGTGPAGAATASDDAVTLSGSPEEPSAESTASRDPGIDSYDGSRLQTLRLLLERLTGRKIRTITTEDMTPRESDRTTGEVRDAPVAANTTPAVGAEYRESTSHTESEQTSFDAEGVVRTVDGREIRFSVAFDMERSYSENQETVVRIGAAPQDPLVVNLNRGTASLDGATVEFDLNSDGTMETIPFPAAGSGFLAMDRNGDGKIGNGSELFGPSTGNGFTELAALDSDGNHWIDEGDSAFTQLRIWSRTAAGSDQVSTLGQLGVGALHVQSAETPFRYGNTAEDSQGALRTSSVYLKEDGTAGTVQQLDLVV